MGIVFNGKLAWGGKPNGINKFGCGIAIIGWWWASFTRTSSGTSCWVSPTPTVCRRMARYLANASGDGSSSESDWLISSGWNSYQFIITFSMLSKTASHWVFSLLLTFLATSSISNPLIFHFSFFLFSNCLFFLRSSNCWFLASINWLKHAVGPYFPRLFWSMCFESDFTDKRC